MRPNRTSSSILVVGAMAASIMSACLGGVQRAEQPRGDTQAAASLSILTWNLGYGGLGAEQNFKTDGGEDWRAKSRAQVESNVDGITRWLDTANGDLLLLQEAARPSFVNHRVDLLGRISQTLDDYWWTYHPVVSTRLIPPPWNVNTGLGIYARQGLVLEEGIVDLPLEPQRFLLPQRAKIVYVRLRSSVEGNDWVIGNVHLAAFDEQGKVRREQLHAVVEFASREFAAGNLVVIGGDWNMRLLQTAFPHTTEERYLFWLQDLPSEAIPPGWSMVADPTFPTVRTLHQAYVPGDNYVTIIDGFLVSPNVMVESIETTDLAFRYSDHQPVRLQVRPRP